MIYYLYQITNLVNGKIYVGIHVTNDLEDGYMGSGKVIKRAIAKHGACNFQKDILEFFDTKEQMYAREKEVVTEEFLERDDVYNLRRGGLGGFDAINKNPQLVLRRNRKIASDRDYSDPEYLTRLSEANKRGHVGKSFPKEHILNWCGRKHSEETKKKMSELAKGRIPWNKGLTYSKAKH